MLAIGTKVKISERYPSPGPADEADRFLHGKTGVVGGTGNTPAYQNYNVIEYDAGGFGLFLDVELDVIDD